jgi:hypothetical protein
MSHCSCILYLVVWFDQSHWNRTLYFISCKNGFQLYSGSWVVLSSQIHILPVLLGSLSYSFVAYYSAGTGQENRDYSRGDTLRWPRDTVYQLKLALISPAGCGRLVGIVRLRTKTTEFSSVYYSAGEAVICIRVVCRTHSALLFLFHLPSFMQGCAIKQ